MYRKILAVMCAIYFFATSLTAYASMPERKIGILKGVSQVNLQVSEPCIMINPETKEKIDNIEPDKPFTIDFSSMRFNAIEIRGTISLRSTINGKKYFGGIRINKNSNSLTVINLAPVEEYLRGVLPEEMPPYFSLEALKAQAVAARSFTLKNKNLHQNEGFDLCTTTHCQVYEGVSSISDITDKAVAETSGMALCFNGSVALATFHTDSGGMTESNANVWGTEVPYLQPAEELVKKTQVWNVKVDKEIFAKKMGADFGELHSITLSDLVIGQAASDRTNSGRVKTALIVGSKKNVQLSGNDLRNKFSLPSTLFNIRFQGLEVIFEGYGRGHGIGMSQCGAEAYAKNGWTYDKILNHYYKGTELKKLY